MPKFINFEHALVNKISLKHERLRYLKFCLKFQFLDKLICQNCLANDS